MFPKKLCALGILDININLVLRKGQAEKYDFEYSHEKLLPLSAKVKELVEEKTKFGDWKNTARKAELEAELIMLLDDNGYPPVPEDEVINDVFDQAENYRKYNNPITG